MQHHSYRIEAWGNTHTSCSYYGIWDVNYYVKELDRKIYSDIESMYGYAHSGIAYNAANKEHPINSNSSCWYNGCSSPSDDAIIMKCNGINQTIKLHFIP